MKKGYISAIFLAVIFGFTALFGFAYAKDQNEEIRYYKESFFIKADDLLTSYQLQLDYEKDYFLENDNEKKQQLLQNHADLSVLANERSATARALLYDQVNVDQFVVLETKVLEEIRLFQETSSDSERQVHLEKLEEALPEFEAFIQDGMEENDVCVKELCNE